jgi:crotonobetaine/carnitine-CoA ligase
VDSWLHTGDCGLMDGDGYLYFMGRFKELIRRGGEMISPVEIELQLLKHPCVQDCAVIGIADEIMGEEIKAMIVSVEPLDPLEVRSFLSERLPNHMLPRYVAFVPAIPKTATQKIIRHELAALDVPAIDLRTYAACRG